MDSKLIVLKLILDALAIDSAIATVDDRKRVQKALYLEQLRGIDLGYRFSWYHMGPYCPGLTRDYYSLAEAIARGDRQYERKRLKSHMMEGLNNVQPLLQVPGDLSLELEDWLEILASYHYLRTVSRRTDADAKEILDKQKSRISIHSDAARRRLEELDVLSSSTNVAV